MPQILNPYIGTLINFAVVLIMGTIGSFMHTLQISVHPMEEENKGGNEHESHCSYDSPSASDGAAVDPCLRCRGGDPV